MDAGSWRGQFPSREVAALVDLVPVDEVAEGLFAPAPRGAVDLGRENRDRDRKLVVAVSCMAAGL